MRAFKGKDQFFDRGFTFIWTIFVVALLGCGLLMASMVYSTTAKRQREVELIQVGREFRAAIRSYYEASPGGKQYPPSLGDLLRDSRFPGIRRHLRRIYLDPVTGAAEWGTVRVAGRIVGVHSLSEVAPIKVGNFEPSEATFANKEKYSEWVFSYPDSGSLPIGVISGSVGQTLVPQQMNRDFGR